jgi:hypothetical protein
MLGPLPGLTPAFVLGIIDRSFPAKTAVLGLGCRAATTSQAHAKNSAYKTDAWCEQT